MSVQAISIILLNSVTSAFFAKYIVQYVYNKVTKEKDEQILWLLAKITKLENKVNELHENIDSLDEKVQAKENLLKESSEMLFNKIDNFIISNYDTVENEN
jgi:hypothetical protein